MNEAETHRLQADRAALLAVIKTRSLLAEGEVTLASGRTSNFYFDMKRTAFDAQGLALTARLMLHHLRQLQARYVGGLEMGAVPLVAGIMALAEPQDNLQGFFVRKQAKDHGTQRLLEGLLEGESPAGQRTVIVEDVTTTGGSALQAVAAARNAGADVGHVLTIVDRQEGAAEQMAGEGLQLIALLRRDDFKL